MKTFALLSIAFAAVGFASPAPQQTDPVTCTGSDKINVLVSNDYRFLGLQRNFEVCRNECRTVNLTAELELL